MPLQDLAVGRQENLKFPLDNEGDYKGWVKFQFITVAPAGFEWNADIGVWESLKDILFADDIGESVNAGTEAVGTSTSLRPEKSSLSGSVRLYLPQAITFQDGIEYDNNVELGLVGGAAEATLRTGGTISGALAAAREQTVEAVKSVLGGNTNLTGDAARILASRLAKRNTARGNVISSGLRVTPNPNKRTLFRGVRPREFTFTFKMIANSLAEANSIDAIITKFRTEMYPDVLGSAEDAGLDGAGFVAYEYPTMVQPSFKYNDVDVARKIGRCYISSFNTVFNPGSMGWHVQGKPSEVDVTMTLVEERPLDRRDIKEGF